MARYREAKCRLCRREGMKLFLKGDRCFKDTCAIEKRNFAPGQHGKDRRPKTLVGYGLQLREKQKVRRIYGVLEGQFANYFGKAEKKKGITGETLLAQPGTPARQRRLPPGLSPLRGIRRASWLPMGTFSSTARKWTLPPLAVKAGDVITLREKTKKVQQIQDSVATVGGRGGVPAWLQLDAANLKGTVVSLPKREDVQMPIDEQLIVELYSK